VSPGVGLRPLSRSILDVDPPTAARRLIGAWLIRAAEDGSEPRIARIVEVEAYGGGSDLASHARAGRTQRNAAMYAAPGIAYVYLVYGMHHCLNVSVGPVGEPAAVLIRAAEPVSDPGPFRAGRVADAARRRGTSAEGRHPIRAARLLAGPGRLAAAFEVDRSFDGRDLLAPDAPLRLVPAPSEAGDAASGTGLRIVATPRVGIASAPEPWRSLPWRFLDPDSPAVSGPRAVRPR
jgi:DNA-3-methyladenine glycosylase